MLGRIGFLIGLCLVVAQAGVIDISSMCDGAGQSNAGTNNCGITLPGNPIPGSTYASSSYVAPAAFGVSLSASAGSQSQTFNNFNVSTSRLSSSTSARLTFTFDTAGPVRSGLVSLQLLVDEDSNAFGGASALAELGSYEAHEAGEGGECIGCQNALLHFTFGEPFDLIVSTQASSGTQSGSADAGASASVAFQLFEDAGGGRPGTPVQAFAIATAATPEPGTSIQAALSAALLLLCVRVRGYKRSQQ